MTTTQANTKICTACDVEKELSEFHKRKEGRLGVNSKCKPCYNSKRRSSHETLTENEKREKRRNHKYTSRYGLSIVDYENLKLIQESKCAICGYEPEDDSENHESWTKRLVVDHCHDSNRVRGLLCNGCNVGLGSFKDDPDLLVNAAVYLNKINLQRSL
jgi:hypothetical protein